MSLERCTIGAISVHSIHKGEVFFVVCTFKETIYFTKVMVDVQKGAQGLEKI